MVTAIKHTVNAQPKTSKKAFIARLWGAIDSSFQLLKGRLILLTLEKNKSKQWSVEFALWRMIENALEEQ